ncbi:hypothetical protein [Pyrococcus woesei]|uniref:hypothetical protein n=1 Tax=Pyrococcus woesei TaxID=2262 RepID=UPI003D2F14CC
MGEYCKKNVGSLQESVEMKGSDNIAVKNKIGIFFLLSAIIFRILTLPTSPGNFYGPAHYYNLYLPDFGLNSDIAILPHASKTVLSMYLLNKVTLEVLGDILLLHQAIYVMQPLLVFCSYYLFFTFIGVRDYKIFLSGFLSMILGWPGIVLILGMVVLYSFFKVGREFFVLALISFSTLTLYWHSSHMLFFVILLSISGFILVIKIIFKNQAGKVNQYIPTRIVLVTLLSTFVWVWGRKLYGSQNLLSSFREYFYLKRLLEGLFSKGAFVPPEYLYYDPLYARFDPIFDALRYVLYLATFIITLSTSFKALKLNKREEMLGLPLIVGSGAFMFLYYLATYTFGPAPILVFLIPYSLNILTKKMVNRKSFALIMIFFVVLLTITGIYGQYKGIRSSPEFNQDFITFSPPIQWLTEHKAEITIISDANTLGYMTIWYGKNSLYHKSELHFVSIGNYYYQKLYTGNYERRGDIIFVYNYELYRKNLMFESLQAWNKYKPLEPLVVLKNRLNVVYSSQKIWITT